jgi:nucleotide-binding universal stress UspA family protein
MFRQIMVPLDGSVLAEGAIGYAERLARSSILQPNRCGVTLHLARMMAPVFLLDFWGISTYAIIAEDNKAEMQRAAGYLDALRQRPRDAGIWVRTALLSGSLVAGLLEYQHQHGIDLVVLASHEQTGIGHLQFGSLLQPLLRRGPAPLFVVPPAIDTTSLQHALVPLDGSAGAEQALTLLCRLPPTLVREVTLLRVVDTQEETFEAFRYLSCLRQRPELAHLRSHLRVVCGDPAEYIVDLGRDHLVVLTKARHWLPSPDSPIANRLIHLATHWLSESIAHRVIRNGAAAVLIARQGTHSVRGDGSGARSQHSSRFPRAS